MRHPSDGTLRRLLDEPSAVADADRDHIANCPTCTTRMLSVREDAALAANALHTDVTADVGAGWRRLTAAGPDAAGEPHRRTKMRSPLIAVAAVAALLTGATAAAAGNWLPIFRTESVAPITVTHADLLKLPDLDAYGEVAVTARPDIRRVGSAAAAREATGLEMPRVTALPRGVSGEPVFQVGNRVAATFTFDADRAARSAGRPIPPPPAGLDGSQFRFTAGPGVAAIWLRPQGTPQLLVARAKAPAVFSAGVPYATARDYLLTLPGLPEAVAAQLRAFTGDGTTLPLIVKQGRETTSTEDVGGHPATVLALKDGTLAGVIWVSDGVVTAVAGPLSAAEVLTVARGLR